MAKAATLRAGHDKHLCYVNNLGFQTSCPRDYKALVKNGQFLCKVCGRVAAGGRKLCKAVKAVTVRGLGESDV